PGYVCFEPLPSDRLRGRGSRAVADREATIALAGDPAVRRHRGRPLAASPSLADVAMAYDAALHAGPAPGRLEARFDPPAQRAAMCLRLGWPVVLAVAGALLERGTPTGEEVGGVILGARAALRVAS